ncbi:FecR domain-containing protein [Reyranella sp.]|uniref:FecR family protein n=1 Tax=Reyranella sp. TaxID=1929291 RepID=UPI00272EF6C4|nr:FecR domain-containing protein [Reyranella sp.]MDP2372756.1 FecR domain-containing protein [Reyranella sp.]
MAKSAVRSLSVLCALLLGVAAFTLVGAASAIAKVGVTSATDGDPLGKPPTEAERVLRVGIDVQANELITTRADDRAHLMFLDGTALTIGPDASIVIDKFVYDPNTKTGDLAITATKGVFRLVGGRISKTNPITITTPSSTIGIRGGVGILNVNSRETISFFIFGFSMTIGANGRIETVTRPGSEVTTLFGSGPGRPRMITAGVMNGILGQLQGSGKGGSPGGGSGNADQSAQNSGFSNSNSGKGTNVSGTRSFDNFGSGPGPNNRNPNDTVVTALTQANETAPSLQPTTPKTENIIPIVNTMTSTITYKGTMSGIAFHNGNPSKATGIYTNVWNVGPRNGIASVQFNGAAFGGGTTPNTFAVGNSSVFVTPTPLPSTTGVPGRSLSLVGTTSPTSQVGGFVITGPRYGAVGTFQGTKQ